MKRWACSMVSHIGIWVRGQSYIGWRRKLYSYGLIPIQLCEVTSIRLLLRVWIKVVDEWQVNLGYVRGSNIYVRGYLDLRAWSLRLRTQTEENHYVKTLFSSRERCFSLCRIRGILAIRRRACVSLRRSISGSRALRCLSTLNRGQESRQQPPQGNLIEGFAWLWQIRPQYSSNISLYSDRIDSHLLWITSTLYIKMCNFAGLLN